SDQNKSNGSVASLFNDAQHQQMQIPALPVVDPWTSLIQLKREKEVTGMYLSGHPLEDYRLELSCFCNATIAELDNFKNQDVTIAGIVAGLESKMSRNGKPFGVFTLEDFSGTTEMVLWGEDFLKYKHFLESNSMLFIKGKYQPRFNSDDRWELKISSVQLLQDVREKMTKKVTLTVSLPEVSDETIDRMEKLLAKHKGNYPVAVRVDDIAESFSLNFAAAKSGVSLSDDFMSEVNEIPEVEIRLS
ncbi:MAG: OB-fold nucleic acid binding domain-containing protein, partial [Chitinophagales bacterium]